MNVFCGYISDDRSRKKTKSKDFNIYIILKSYEIGCNLWACDLLGEKKTEFCALCNAERASAKVTEK